VVRICQCGRLDVEHDYRPATKTLPARRLGTDNGACAGYREARVEERPPESELRRRLAAVVALTAEPPPAPAPVPAEVHRAWQDGWDAAVTAAVLAATGESNDPSRE
jgi:hypothetical protein